MTSARRCSGELHLRALKSAISLLVAATERNLRSYALNDYKVFLLQPGSGGQLEGGTEPAYLVPRS
jgi:hypothetical protein